MDDENDGAQATQGSTRRRAGGAARPRKAHKGQDGEAQGPQQVAPAGAVARSLSDYKSQLAAKDAQIQELQQKVAEATKTSEATQDLNGRIVALKQAMADERVESALISAGARNVKATKTRRRRAGPKGRGAVDVPSEFRSFTSGFTKQFTTTHNHCTGRNRFRARDPRRRQPC